MRRVPEQKYRSKVLLPGVWSFTAVVGIYLPGAIRRSAWSDDLVFLSTADCPICYEAARPIEALAIRALFHSIDSLALVRCIGVLGIAMLAATLAISLARWGVPGTRATLWAIAAVLLPSFHSFAAWANAFLKPWAALLGLLAGLLWVGDTKQRRAVRHLSAYIGLTIALLLYPPSAMFCWVYLGLRILVLRTQPQRAFRQLIGMTCLVSLSIGTFLLVSFIIRHIRETSFSYRLGIVNTLSGEPVVYQIFEKLIWFVSHPIVIATRLFWISSPSALNALVTGGPILLCVMFVLISRHQRGYINSLFSLLIHTVILSFSGLTHLLVWENQFEYRFFAGLSVLMFAYISVAGAQVLDRGRSILLRRADSKLTNSPESLLLILLSGVVVFGAYLSITNIDRVFIEPFETKEHYIQEALHDFDPEVHSQIIAISEPSLYPSRSHLGAYSTVTDLAHPWVPAPSIRLVLREFHGITDPVEILVQPSGTWPPPNLTPTDFIVDFRPYADSLRG